MKKKLLMGLLVLAMSASTLMACGEEKSNTNVSENEVSENKTSANNALVDMDQAKNDVVMTIKSADESVVVDVTVQDVYLYAVQYFFNNGTLASQVDASYQAIIDEIITEIKVEIVQYEVAKLTDGIEISDEDKTSIDIISRNFYDYFGEEFLSKYGIDYDCVYKLFERQKYIDLLRAKSLNDSANDYYEEYSKKYKDMEFFSIYYVLFPSIKYENGKPVMEEDGSSYVLLSDDEMAASLAQAEELLEKAQANVVNGNETGDLEALAKEYGVDFVSKTEHGYKGAYSEELNAVIDELNDGDISDVVETEAGYMIVRMDNANDEEFKEYSIRSMANQSAETFFSTLQSAWVSGSGVENVPYESSLVEGLELKSLCSDMNANGYAVGGK